MSVDSFNHIYNVFQYDHYLSLHLDAWGPLIMVHIVFALYVCFYMLYELLPEMSYLPISYLIIIIAVYICLGKNVCVV